MQPQTPIKIIRVLVVDDSALMRKIISGIIASSPDMEVAGTARDGEDALVKLRELKPDVITLDVEMPSMNGLAFLEAMMPIRPTPVVMISSLTTEGAETTFACLQRGAVDFVGKPSGSISVNLGDHGHEIADKVRAAAHARVKIWHSPSDGQRHNMARIPARRGMQAVQETADSASTAAAPHLTRTVHSGSSEPHFHAAPPNIVMIASSTGGPAALTSVIPRLPADLNAGYVIVQHLPVGFTKSLAERLNRESALTVREAAPGDQVMRGVVLIAPAGTHLEFDNVHRVVLKSDPPLWGIRPAADVTMRSVAACFGRRVIGVVLTGMGRDGALGVKAIKQAGGVCFAQDEATCVVYGMPRCAVETGEVDRIVPLPLMAEAIANQLKTMSSPAERTAA